MRRLQPVSCIVVVLCVVLSAASARAQATRTWVSGVGDDANPCSRTAPCKTFAGAISKTAVGGEIDALDPGGFGAVNIIKAITIDGRGTLASIVASGVNGITVNAGATDVVILRGLSLTGVGTGLSAIQFNTGAALHVEDCVMNGFTTAAINFTPPAATPSMLFVKRVSATNNAGGIIVSQAGQAVISKSNFFNDGVGLDVQNTAKATIHDSVFAGNATAGIRTAATAFANMDHGIIAGNLTGVQANGLVRLSEVMISHNVTGLAGAMVTSFGNNRVTAGNGTDGAPNSTIPLQ